MYKGFFKLKMAQALSPTAKAATKDACPTTTKEFAEYVKYYQQCHKAIVRLTALVNKLPANQPLKIESHTIRRNDINKYSQAYVSQLGNLRKMFANRKRKSTRNNSQLNSLFYVSDQLISFYDGAKLGPLDPSNPKGRKLSSEIDILTSTHMSTSGILTSLISRYIDSNKLKTEGSPGRFMPDSRMKSALTNTVYTLKGEDLSKRDIAPETVPEKVIKIKDSISIGKKSAFARVSGRTDKRTGSAVYDTKTGLLYTTMMVFNNFYRIPTALLTIDEKAALLEQDNIDEAKELQEKLSRITEYHHKK